MSKHEAALELVAVKARQYLDTGRGDLDGALAALAALRDVEVASTSTASESDSLLSDESPAAPTETLRGEERLADIRYRRERNTTPRAEDVDYLLSLVAPTETLREDVLKIAAYDAARAVVKTEGNTRAYYVLRAEAAEAQAETLREALEAVLVCDPGFEKDIAAVALAAACGVEVTSSTTCESPSVHSHGDTREEPSSGG